MAEEGATVSPSTSTKVASTATTSKENTMSKPQSYFSIQDHTFTVRGRKENKGKDLEQTEPALYFENEVLAIPYQPMPTVPPKMKYVKLAGLKEIAGVLEAGYSEETTAAVLKEKGYKELVTLLKENKILVLDFCSWVKDELAKFPAKPRGRQAGSEKLEMDSQDLVSMLAGIPDVSPTEASNMLKALVNDEEKMKAAISILEQKEQNNGRRDGHIILRFRKPNQKKQNK
jgi:hypothetical protein